MKRLAKYSLATLLANIGVILWGAFVRASGSGAGCGSHWPLCNGEVVPQTPAFETLVELTHRLTSGIALFLVVGLVLATFRSRAKGDPTRLGSVLVLLFMLSEAAVGAGIVLFELVVDDSSVARAAVLAIHLLNTFLLLGACTLTTLWANGEERPKLRTFPEASRWLLLAVVAVLLLGATGAISALGDTLFPTNSLQAALEQDLDPSSHWLLRVRSVHPALAVIVGLLLLKLPQLIGRQRLAADAKRWANFLALGVLVQFVVGALSIFLLVPVWLQLVHLGLADLIWIQLVLFGHAVLSFPPTASEPIE